MYVNSSAKQALDWIHDTGDFYLSTHTDVGRSREETEGLLLEHNEFKATAKVKQNCFFVALWSHHIVSSFT